jgi:hypothetical protein
MHYVHLGFDRNIRLLIPSAWNAFVYRGFVYRRDSMNRWRPDQGWKNESDRLKRFT